MKLSIIIPVYNAAVYLQDCLDSVLKQEIKAIEIICINDGSKDDSGKILEEYKNKHSCIKVIHQKNQGVSAARNAGIKMAIGEYLTFIDADDTIKKDAFSFLNNLIEKPDIIVGTSFVDSSLFNNAATFYDRKFIVEKLLPSYLQTEQNNSVCDKYYKRAIINEQEILFPEGKPLGEDGIFNVQFFLHAQSLLLLPYASYIYRQNENSATNSLNRHDFLSNFIEDSDRYSAYYHLMSNSPTEITKWTSLKMLNNIRSILSLYFRASKSVSKVDQRKMVQKMLRHEKVVAAMKEHYATLQVNASLFDKMINWAIKHQSYILLKLLYTYSHYRNGIK